MRVVPAGWYDDPDDPALVRWWNGLGWTEHTETKPERPVQPAAAVAQQPVVVDAEAALRASLASLGYYARQHAARVADRG